MVGNCTVFNFDKLGLLDYYYHFGLKFDNLNIGKFGATRLASFVPELPDIKRTSEGKCKTGQAKLKVIAETVINSRYYDSNGSTINSAFQSDFNGQPEANPLTYTDGLGMNLSFRSTIQHESMHKDYIDTFIQQTRAALGEVEGIEACCACVVAKLEEANAKMNFYSAVRTYNDRMLDHLAYKEPSASTSNVDAAKAVLNAAETKSTAACK